jgi:hypothetical protein
MYEAGDKAVECGEVGECLGQRDSSIYLSSKEAESREVARTLKFWKPIYTRDPRVSRVYTSSIARLMRLYDCLLLIVSFR